MLATVQTNVSHFHHHHTGCQKKKGKEKRKEPHPSLDLMSFSLGSISNEWNVTSVLPPYEKRDRECIGHLLLRHQLKNRGEKKGNRM